MSTSVHNEEGSYLQAGKLHGHQQSALRISALYSQPSVRLVPRIDWSLAKTSLSSEPVWRQDQSSIRTSRTVSPTNSVYTDYVDTVGSVVNEATIVFEVSERLLKEYLRECYKRAFKQVFAGFPNEVGFNNSRAAEQTGYLEDL
ncbi:hypothetical protein F5Y19DRAFT_484128 [Xylariaceae sp. FL1651]|nr:hypothetical protein F5Y19DRAFT_484128 [Xylariaceae sp. FL1651]